MQYISIIIPSYNRVDRLKRVFRALEKQTYPLDCFEVLVISDGSTDGTDEYLRSYSGTLMVRPLFQENKGPAAARNFGITQAKGEMIVFLDDDVVPQPELIEEHLKVHTEYQEDVVVLGPMLSPPGFEQSPWIYWEQEMLMKQYTSIDSGVWQPTSRQFYTGNASVARHLLMEAGGFDISLRRAEDVELAYRLEVRGVRFLFNPEAIGYHYAERTFDSWSRIPYDYGRNDILFYTEKGIDWMLPFVYREFDSRNPIIKFMVWLCLDHPFLTQISVSGFRWISIKTYRLGLKRISNQFCSSIFNVLYYQGAADALGGRMAFYAGA